MRRLLFAALLAGLALPAGALASRPLVAPAPIAVAEVAALSYTGTVCGGITPKLEWDFPTPADPQYQDAAWVDGPNPCSSPIIHLNAPYWDDGNHKYLAAYAWPQFCTMVLHEDEHFTDINWNGAPETNDPTSVEYDGPWVPSEEPSQCGHGGQLWVFGTVTYGRHESLFYNGYLANEAIPAYREMMAAEASGS